MKLVTLKKRRDFKRLALTGQKLVFPHFIIQFSFNTSSALQDCVAFGVTASKKVGNAVLRNRAKRRMRVVGGLLYESLRLHLKDKEIDFSFVLIARYTLPKAPFSELQESVQKAARILQEKWEHSKEQSKPCATY